MNELHLTRATIVLDRPPANERGVTREYLVHQAVADLFGDRDGRGYVWRDLSPGDRDPSVLILSRAPVTEQGARQAPAHRRFTSVASKPFRPLVGHGERVDFEIRVNATRVVTTPGAGDGLSPGAKPRKARRDLWDCVFDSHPSPEVRMQDVYAEWLRRQLHGLVALGHVAVTERRLVRVRRCLGSAPVSFVSVNLVGDLSILDPQGLVARMAGGIGRARAFGCGLLCLARHGTRPRASSAS